MLARKAAGNDGRPALELLELAGGESGEQENCIHHASRKIDADYRDLEDFMGYQPLKLVPLPAGACQRLTREIMGARLNPPPQLLDQLLPGQPPAETLYQCGR